MHTSFQSQLEMNRKERTSIVYTDRYTASSARGSRRVSIKVLMDVIPLAFIHYPVSNFLQKLYTDQLTGYRTWQQPPLPENSSFSRRDWKRRIRQFGLKSQDNIQGSKITRKPLYHLLLPTIHQK